MYCYIETIFAYIQKCAKLPLATKALQPERSYERERRERREREKMRTNLPALIGTYGDDHPFLFQRPILTSPETVLAEVKPILAASVMRSLSLDRTHESIVAPAAAEFARQGRGTRAVTRRTRGFFGGESVETVVMPL
jgi:hypothetical protein